MKLFVRFRVALGTETIPEATDQGGELLLALCWSSEHKHSSAHTDLHVAEGLVGVQASQGGPWGARHLSSRFKTHSLNANILPDAALIARVTTHCTSRCNLAES